MVKDSAKSVPKGRFTRARAAFGSGGLVARTGTEQGAPGIFSEFGSVAATHKHRRAIQEGASNQV